MHKQFGFSHPLVLLLILAVVAAVGFAGWRVWEVSEDEEDDHKASLTAPSAPCEGTFYDSHAHPDSDAILERLPDIMTKHDVGCSVLFTQMDINDIEDSLDEATENYEGLPGRISIFYDIITDDPSEVTKDRLEDLYESTGGKFSGFGEFAFYETAFIGKQLTDAGWPALFEFAGEKGLPIMIHPQESMVGSLEEMLDRYPNTKVIVHGFELPGQMGDLLTSHPNLYFTLDTATMFVLGELTSESIPEHLFYPGGGPNTDFDVEAFVTKYDARKQEIVELAVEKWLPVLLSAPERVMWGSDISLEGHVDDRVYQRVIDLSETFAENVPPAYRSGYLRDNAFDLLGEGARL